MKRNVHMDISFRAKVVHSFREVITLVIHCNAGPAVAETVPDQHQRFYASKVSPPTSSCGANTPGTRSPGPAQGLPMPGLRLPPGPAEGSPIPELSQLRPPTAHPAVLR